GRRRRAPHARTRRPRAARQRRLRRHLPSVPPRAPAVGLAFDAIDLSDLDLVVASWRPQTRMIWIETPTNPLLRIFDIAALPRLAHERDALVVVDNTFATPYLQRPLTLGADIVVHSTTKYLGGHSDVVGGAVVTSDDEIAG